MILAVVLNLVASSLRRSQRRRRTQDILTIPLAACKTLCPSLSAPLLSFSFSGLKGRLLHNSWARKTACFCFHNQTPQYYYDFDFQSNKFFRDSNYDHKLEAKYKKILKDSDEYILD